MSGPCLRMGFAGIALCAAGLALSAAHALDGRVVDASRRPLAGVKVTLSASDQSVLTGADGRFHLGPAAGLPPHRIAAGPVSPEGRAWMVRADGRRAGSASPWLPRFSSRRAYPPDQAPLAKAAAQSLLTVEKAGLATATVLVPENAASLPDIILAPGPYLSTVVGQPQVLPIYSAPRVQFEGGTSTDLPDVYNEGERIDPKANLFKHSDYYNPDGLSRTLYGVVAWSLAAPPGTTAAVRPHGWVPESLGRAEEAPAFKADIEGRFHASIQEGFAFYVRGGMARLGPNPYGDTISMLVKEPVRGNGYATMKWLQFAGPVRAAYDYISQPDNAWSEKIYASHSGAMPPLDTCGRLTGRIDWKGAGARPELWIGMVGTDLFAKVDAEGGFLTTDLPPGTLPLAVVAVKKDGEGRDSSRTFFHLQGLAVSPGHTTRVERLELAEH